MTVVEYERLGHVGGYLVVNGLGRPLEFHCTAPVQPTKAQQILYGPTFRGYLYGERIARTLFENAKSTPVLVCVDLPELLELGEHVSVPVALSSRESSAADGAGTQTRPSIEAPHFARTSQLNESGVENPSANRLPGTSANAQTAVAVAAPVVVTIGNNRLAFARTQAARAENVRTLLEPWADVLDLVEPFTRIREAVEEARRGR
ncbi:MAG: hypothetical protein D6741_10360 [Planctomycetota bacterium]|nr:MAG: hypothetical protein D6741_10360 [Planctomycetota bacterium]